MKSPKDLDCIQLEITNRCTMQCNSCTRFVGHHPNTYHMPLDQVKEAMDSLEGYQGNVGIMGGEPTLHPKFPEILKMLRERFPIEKRSLWTMGYNWEKYYDDIHKTFLPENISYNDHSEDADVKHHPLLIGIDEVVEDKDLMFQFIDACWIQNRWSASINTKGAFMCEVAAAMSYWLKWDFGMDVEPGWWKVTPDDEIFKEQILSYCVNCSGCLPVPFGLKNTGTADLCSPMNYKRLKKTTKKEIEIADIEQIREYLKGKSAEPGEERGSLKDFPEWRPWDFRQYQEMKLRDKDGKLIDK